MRTQLDDLASQTLMSSPGFLHELLPRSQNLQLIPQDLRSVTATVTTMS
jgi:hypothetical protein